LRGLFSSGSALKEWRGPIEREANDADEACRKAAASLLDLSLPEVHRMMEQAALEVIAVIKGDPQFEPTKKTSLFPGI